jgi:hypothetical protein
MSHTQQKGTREPEYSLLEERTRIAREDAKPSVKSIRRAKARSEERAERRAAVAKLAEFFLTSFDATTNFNRATESRSRLITHDVKKMSEAKWFSEIAKQTGTQITRVNEINLLFRGLPANIRKAQEQILNDLAKGKAKPTAFLQ